MSLSIPTDEICAVYALGEWHPVLPGTFFIDAYELCEDFGGGHQHHYMLGQTYEETPKVNLPQIPGSLGEHWIFSSPQGCDGCQWTEPGTSKQKVCMSLLEIKAFKLVEDKNKHYRI
jgi:hypothetical protein